MICIAAISPIAASLVITPALAGHSGAMHPPDNAAPETARGSLLTFLGFSLAFIHLFPARKHLVLFLEAPSLSEAWKAFGAVVAIALLALPRALQRRLIHAIWRERRVASALGLLLALVHLVPMLDHVPAFFASWTWADAWRGVGASAAVLWFASPHRSQSRAMAFVARRRPMIRLATVPAMFAMAATALWVGCGDSSATPGAGTPSVDASASLACPPCVTDQDCNGGVCAQLGSDSFCAPTCPAGNECATDRACTSVSTVTGDQVDACVARAGECAATPPAMADSGATTPAACPGLVPPPTAASCPSCRGKSTCQPNGCFGGWWCNTATNRCQSPPTSCGGAAGAAGGAAFDGGAPVTSNVGATGGTSSRVYFAVVGDTRPAGIDDTTGYPTAIIEKIYTDIESLSPRPAFVLGTGDYMFASPFGAQSGPQLELYLGARAKYSGVAFAAMGNHECTGATASNCGPGSANGITNNYTAFVDRMLGPIGKSDPYYAVRVDAADGSWTSKTVIVAANAWSAAQAAWLEAELAIPTTYTFLVRHESHSVTQAPGVAPAEKIMAAHPYTLSFVGHTHTYEHFATSREVVIGNGGAPATGSKNYGFAVVQQRSDNAIQVDVLDYATLATDTTFRFAVKSDGSPAP
ncbi:MAG: hypothetical protein JWP87_4540 [Labilithrix sp.]|nr:hypothetical protein [Labilithrix sp.]